MSSSSDAGIGGAVEDAVEYGKLSFYYYKLEAYMVFHGSGTGVYHLTLYKSPTFFRLPRVVPNRQVLLDYLQNLSLASQVEFTKALVDDKGRPRQFTPRELSGLIEKVAGMQESDVRNWVLSNFYDDGARQFMNCVSDSQKLAENTYGPNEQAEVLNGLTVAEHDKRAAVRKLTAGRLFGW